ncbi:hypothetical protein ES703_14659 [subsurface metagenome]
MELTQPTTEVLVVVLGNTYPVKEQLKSLGFQWNAVNQVWYNLSNWTAKHYESWATEMKGSPWPDVYYRFFELRENVWTEIYQ